MTLWVKIILLVILSLVLGLGSAIWIGSAIWNRAAYGLWKPAQFGST